MQTLTANVRPVSEQIAEIRDNYPQSIALSDGDRHLSYEELDRSADRFAGYMAQLGVVSGGTVAICMERSFDWIIAALGIMRAGAAYVPLDSAWPGSRLRFAVEDSGATVLVARAALLDRLQVKAQGIDPYRDAEAIASAGGVPHGPIQLQSDSLAYVVYTSGTTGVPKGVEITHANLAHLIRWHRDAFNVTRRDRASHLAGLGFDAAAWEIWPHLSVGATVCLADDEVRSSPDLIQNWMIRERVTIGFVPTVYAERMTDLEWPVSTSLRFLLTGGDILHHSPTMQLPFDVVNNYGPTECTVVATSSLLIAGSQGAPSIGRPIAGTSVYLLNEDGEQVPDGSTGEIYIGGSGVGRGYRNLADSNNRSFLTDPFSGAPSARMYRTGDRGVRRPDGEIEFRGRLDRQTKIRGQRVELDEIGSVLSQHPSIVFATAITTISQTGENQLVAYVLPRENTRVPTTHELQKHLLGSLPDYMTPPIFVRLQALPISPNGKLDLTMLAQPADANLLDGLAARAPASPTEEKLLAIVRKLLENDAVAPEDSFFLAGGHSLLGMQLVMRVRDVFGVDLTLRQLFEAPTVKRLALLLETMFIDSTVRRHAEHTQRNSKHEPLLPPGVLALQPSGAHNGIFWVDAACAEELAKAIGDDQPFLSVVLTAEDSASLGEAPTLERIATCLVHKILATQSKGPYTIGGYCLGGIIGYEISSQLRAAGHEVALLVLLDAPNPSYIESCDTLKRKVKYLRYVLGRAARLGPWTSFVYLRDHLLKRFGTRAGTKSTITGMRISKETMDAAALAYRPKKYDGKVLLLLASERPPHLNFLPGWQAVVPHNLHPYYVDSHHRDLQKGKDFRSVADAILSHLISASRHHSLSCCSEMPGSTCSSANGKLD